MRLVPPVPHSFTSTSRCIVSGIALNYCRSLKPRVNPCRSYGRVRRANGAGQHRGVLAAAHSDSPRGRTPHPSESAAGRGLLTPSRFATRD